MSHRNKFSTTEDAEDSEDRFSVSPRPPWWRSNVIRETLSARTLSKFVELCHPIPSRPGTRPQLLLKFRVHRLRAARRQVGRDAVPRPDVLEKRVLVQREMRHVSLFKAFVDRCTRM